jgi:hypothetical protein
MKAVVTRQVPTINMTSWQSEVSDRASLAHRSHFTSKANYALITLCSKQFQNPNTKNVSSIYGISPTLPSQSKLAPTLSHKIASLLCKNRQKKWWGQPTHNSEDNGIQNNGVINPSYMQTNIALCY